MAKKKKDLESSDIDEIPNAEREEGTSQPMVGTVPAAKRLIMAATSKGGCGKSYFLIQLIEYLLRHPLKPRVVGFDPDFENSTLTGYHPELVVPIDVEQPSEMDKPLITLFDGKADIAVVDGLGSQQNKRFHQGWVEEIGLFGLRDQVPGGLDITYVHMIQEDVETVDQASELYEKVGPNVQWLFVKNLVDSPRTRLWDAHPVRARALAEGAREMTLQRLWIEGAFVANKMRLPIARAANIGNLFMTDKQRFLTATRLLDAEFESVIELILPSSMIEVAGP